MFQTFDILMLDWLSCNDVIGISVPTNAQATVVTSHSIQITWEPSPSSGAHIKENLSAYHPLQIYNWTDALA